MLSVQTNLTAMSAANFCGRTQLHIGKSTEKLSSGYRINRSADDATGLAVSEKMRRQIRGLTQASANAQDGISMVQTADGAMGEIHDMLHRMSELSIKASNETLTAEDLGYVQSEIDALISEINSVAYKTTFNEQPLLLGPAIPPVVEGARLYNGLPSWMNFTKNTSLSQSFTTDDPYTITTNGDKGTIPVSHDAAFIDLGNFRGGSIQIDELISNGFYTSSCSGDDYYSIEFTVGTGGSVSTIGSHTIFQVGISGAADGEALIDRILVVATERPNNQFTGFAKNPDNPNQLVIYDRRPNSPSIIDDLPDDARLDNGYALYDAPDMILFQPPPEDPEFPEILPDPYLIIDPDWVDKTFVTVGTAGNGYGKLGSGVAHSPEDRIPGYSKRLLVGTNVSDPEIIKIILPNMRIDNLGISEIDVRTAEGVRNAIKLVKGAGSFVSHERSRMGAYQNRLEHTINNLDNQVENTQQAESNIRNADMASEMVTFSVDQILLQAGQSMLSQANQQNQAVLALLQ